MRAGGGMLPERPLSRTGVRLRKTVGPWPPGRAGHRPGEPHKVRAWSRGCVGQAQVSQSLGASPKATHRVGPSGAGGIKHPNTGSASGEPGSGEAAAFLASAWSPGPDAGWEGTECQAALRADCHGRAYGRPGSVLAFDELHSSAQKSKAAALPPPAGPAPLQSRSGTSARGSLNLGCWRRLPVGPRSLPSFKTAFILFCLYFH